MRKNRSPEQTLALGVSRIKKKRTYTTRMEQSMRRSMRKRYLIDSNGIARLLTQ